MGAEVGLEQCELPAGFCSQPQGEATFSELSFGGKMLLCVPQGHVGWSRKHTHTPGREPGWCLFWGGRSMAVTSSLRSHHSHFVKPELQPHLQHGGRMKTALDRRGSLPNSLQLGREAPQQHSSPLTPKFDLPWSLEELREGQDAAQLSWGMDAVPLRMKPRCLGQRCCPQKQKLVRVPAPRAPGKVAASSE